MSNAVKVNEFLLFLLQKPYPLSLSVSIETLCPQVNEYRFPACADFHYIRI